jgi:hypothetical protein
MRLKSCFIALFALCPLFSTAQSSFAPLNDDYYQKIDRYEVKSGKIYPQVFTGIKQYKRSDIVAFIDSIQADGGIQSNSDQFNFDYLRNDNWEWSEATTAESRRAILKHFYRKKSDFYSVSTADFDVHINPVMYVGAGSDSRRDDQLFINTRGIEVRGMVDKKVGFYTYLTDNQMIVPSYVFDQQKQTLVIPHEGFWKGYKDGSGIDFLQARGYITFEATKHINLQFGHDRFFIGQGYRSMILSDNAPPALFLKGNVKVWKLNYFFLINRFTADVTGNTGGLTSAGRYPDKYMALHHFSFNVGKKLNIGVFESVIFSPEDSVSQGKFDMAYLNPIIFYRAIEQQNGSSDNVLLGLDFKWNAIKKVQLYGQLTLDEFVIDNIREGNGWWANKYGAQLGLKYVDVFGVSNLDVQGEVNVVRPYTYSHNTPYGNYSSYRQPIAHPLGANFKEVVGIVRYQPVPRLNVTGKLIVARIGRDTLNSSTSWGSDILKLNTPAARVNEYGNEIGQGISNDILFGNVTVSWMLKHNVFIDASYTLRESKSSVAAYTNNTTVTSVALRWNIAQRLYEF